MKMKIIDERELCTYNFQHTIIREGNYIYIGPILKHI